MIRARSASKGPCWRCGLSFQAMHVPTGLQRAATPILLQPQPLCDKLADVSELNSRYRLGL
jgi:hypothetical protein